MKICYVDESGHCGEKADPKQPVEVLCGVVTDATKLFKTQKEHADIIDFLQEKGISLKELKAKEIYRGKDEWNSVSPQFRDKLYTHLLEWGTSRKCKFIICPIDSNSFFTCKASGCALANRLHFPWEAGALNIIMAIQREFDCKSNNKGKTLVIFDEQKKHDDRFLKLFEGDLGFTDGFTEYVPKARAKSPPRLDQIIDIPHFSKSHLSVLIQLADLGAYVVNRYLLLTHYAFTEDYVGELVKVKGWYEQIGTSLISNASIDAPGGHDICKFYRELRPTGWRVKNMKSSTC